MVLFLQLAPLVYISKQLSLGKTRHCINTALFTLPNNVTCYLYHVTYVTLYKSLIMHISPSLIGQLVFFHAALSIRIELPSVQHTTEAGSCYLIVS